MESTLTENSSKCIGEILISNLSKVEDKRSQKHVFYPLTEILFLILVARICGIKDDTTTVTFGETKLNWFRKYLPYKNGIPSHDVLNSTLRVVSPTALSKVLTCTLDIIQDKLEGKMVNIDGKRLRGSARKEESQKKLSEGGEQSKIMVNVFCAELSMCLTSHEVQSKGGEKAVIGDILDAINLKGALISIDSAYCYKDVVEKFVKNESDYLAAVKGNQGNLYEAVAQITEFSTDVDLGKSERGHGRIEERVCKVVNIEELKTWQKIEYESILNQWPKLQTIIRIESERTETKKEIAKTEIRYYITSKKLSAIEANEMVRRHWAIENGLHWVLDVVIGEDGSRKRKDASAINNSIINKLAFNFVFSYDCGKKISKKAKMMKCGWDENFLENILGLK